MSLEVRAKRYLEKFERSRWILALFLLVALPAQAERLPEPQWSGKVGVILQGFHWHSASNTNAGGRHVPWYSVLSRKATVIGRHFDAIWMPPASKAAVEEAHEPYAQGYLPYSLRDLNSDYGTERQLESTLGKLRRRGVVPIADIVLNHIAPDAGEHTDKGVPYVRNESGPYQYQEHHRVVDFEATDIVQESGGKGACDTGKQFCLVADVDHTSPHAQRQSARYMGRLGRIGFRGMRYDFAKGFAPEVISQYNRRVKPCFSVAELWEDFNDADSHRTQLLEYVKKTGYCTSTFDFTTKAVLQSAVAKREYWRLRDSQGKPAGMIGIAPEYAVTFVDNHDTGSSPGKKNPAGESDGGQKHWEFPCDQVMQGYAYILTHPGIPTVYWPHYFDWQSPHQKTGMKRELDQLIGLRRQMGIQSSSKVRIAEADGERYAAYIRGNNGVMAMKIGPGDWKPSSPERWKLSAYGINYAVWTKKHGVGGGQ